MKRFFIYYLAINFFWIGACGDDDDSTPGQAPSDFSITIVGGNVAGTFQVNWTSSVDPDGTAVVYDLYLDDNLVASDLTSRNYVLDGLAAQTEYTIRVVARDENGDTTEASTTFTTP